MPSHRDQANVSIAKAVIGDSNDRAAGKVTKAGVQERVFPREMPFGTDDGNVGPACEYRTPAEIRTACPTYRPCSLASRRILSSLCFLNFA